MKVETIETTRRGLLAGAAAAGAALVIGIRPDGRLDRKSVV